MLCRIGVIACLRRPCRRGIFGVRLSEETKTNVRYPKNFHRHLDRHDCAEFMSLSAGRTAPGTARPRSSHPRSAPELPPRAGRAPKAPRKCQLAHDPPDV